MEKTDESIKGKDEVLIGGLLSYARIIKRTDVPTDSLAAVSSLVCNGIVLVAYISSSCTQPPLPLLTGRNRHH